jgi:autotransporter translocation and assembly factor TamB
VGRDIAVRSAAGDYTLSGTWPYALRGNALIAVRDFASVPIKMEAQLAKDRLIVRSADLRAFDGQAHVAGEVVWAPGQSWSVAGTAADINPGKLRPDLPGQLNFGFNAQGQGFTGDADFSVELKDIAGRLRGLTARGGGKLAHRAKAWELSAVRVGLGQTNVALDGKIAETLALKFTVDATDMSLLAAGSRGGCTHTVRSAERDACRHSL